MCKNEQLKKRARSKMYNYAYINKFIELDSPLHDSYINTKFCLHNIEITENGVRASYCKNRFCLNCSRIKSGFIIAKYQKWFEYIQQKNTAYLVTLTIPNVSAEDLRKSIKKMNKFFREFSEKRRKKGLKNPQMLRKLECTYNIENDTYHPHFHIIVNVEEITYYVEHLVFKWLEYFPTSSEYAQDVRIGYNLKELAKYATKLIVNKNNNRKMLPVKNLDVIYTALTQLRIYQPQGFTKEDKIKFCLNKENEENAFEKLTALDYEKFGLFTYKASVFDWVEVDSGEILVNYKPTNIEMKLKEIFEK